MGSGILKADPTPPLFYIIEDIDAQAIDETAVLARDKALKEAQVKGLLALLERLSGRSSSFWKNTVSIFSEERLAQLISDFEITAEKVSQNHYAATFTFRFKQKEINALLHQEGLSPHTPLSMPILVIPVLKINTKLYLWEDENLWKKLWQEGSLSSSNIPLMTPLGDLEDIQSLDATQALQNDASCLNLLVERYKTSGGGLIALATLTPESPLLENEKLPVHSLDLHIDLLGNCPLPKTEASFKISSGSGETTRDLLDRAVRDVIKVLNKTWAENPPLQTPQDLLCTASFNQPHEWFFIRQALDDLKNRRILLSFSIHKITSHSASLSLKYQKDLSSLVDSFHTKGLNLTEDRGQWQVMVAAKMPPRF